MGILAVDYGSRYVGLAYTAESLFPQPLTTVSNKQALEHITALVHKHTVDRVVVGLPTGALAPVIRSWAAKLQKRINATVVLWDEYHTSRDATAVLVVAGHRRNLRRSKQHQTAAALILQSYLDQQIA